MLVYYVMTEYNDLRLFAVADTSWCRI